MGRKKIFTARWALKESERMTESEWETFKDYAEYFDVSNSELVELALRYSAQSAGKPENYSFNEKSFADMCSRIPGLDALKSSLIANRLDRKVYITVKNMSAELDTKTLIRFYPPYIISAEPNYQLRINIDLSEPLSVSIREKDIEIQCEVR